MGSPVAIAALILGVLFTAPLVLGAYVVAQGQSRAVLMAWFGLVTVVFAGALLAGFGALLFLAAR